MNDDDEFYAWLDDELDEAAAKRVAERVAADPALEALAAQHRGLTGRLRGAFASVITDHAPPPRMSAEVVDLRVRRTARSTGFGLPQWAAVAASLAVGLFAGQFVGDSANAPVESRDGMLVAAAALDRALDTRLASVQDGGQVRIGLTFRDRGNAICRSFTDGTSSGLACREGDRWRVEGMFAAPQGQGGDYRMAAGEDPRLAALVDDRIKGDALDASAEKAALESGWH